MWKFPSKSVLSSETTSRRLGGIRFKFYKPKIRESETLVPFPTDVAEYQFLDISHLHQWDYRDSKRRFEVKLSQFRTNNRRIILDKEERKKGFVRNRRRVAIPDYVPRTSTSILSSIASGLKRDHSAPDYRFYDDPYLIPYNSFSSRDFALSKESGKRAARWIFDSHSDFFLRNRIEMHPPIPSFLPKDHRSLENVDLNADSKTLEFYLSIHDVIGAINVYKMLRDRNRSDEISKEMKLALLETVSYYAESEPEITENYNTTSGMYKSNKINENWNLNNGGITETLSSELVTEYPLKSRLALLYGFSRRNGMENEARTIFETVKTEFGTILPVEAYNSYFRIILGSERTKFLDFKTRITETLMHMIETAQIKPNSRTLYFILYSLSRISYEIEEYSSVCEFALNLISEFKTKLNIEPSIGGYTALLSLFYSSSKNNTTILYDIIDSIMNTDLYLIDPDESTTFLRDAMKICALRHRDLELAQKLHYRITLYGTNSKLLNDDDNHTRYYNYYFLLLLGKSESFSDAMDFYHRFTPHLFHCSWSNYEKMISKMEQLSEFTYLPVIWSDLVGNSFCRIKSRTVKLDMIRKLMSIAERNDFLEIENREQRRRITDVCLRMAKDTFKDYIETESNLQDSNFPFILESIIKILINDYDNNDDNDNKESFFETTDHILSFVMKRNSEMSDGRPPFSKESVKSVFDRIISTHKDRKEFAFKWIDYSLRYDYDDIVFEMGKIYAETYHPLTITENSLLNTMLGHHDGWSPLAEK